MAVYGGTDFATVASYLQEHTSRNVLVYRSPVGAGREAIMPLLFDICHYQLGYEQFVDESLRSDLLDLREYYVRGSAS